MTGTSSQVSDTPATAEDRDARYVLATWQKQTDDRGMEVTRAQGVYFWDRTGRQYLDFTSQYVFCNFGHRDQRVLDAIVTQSQQLEEMAPPFVTGPRSDAAQLLAEITPGDLQRVFFSTSGTEANEAAFKLAKELTGRPLVCSRYPSYHGSTYGSLSLTGNPVTWPYEPGVPGVIRAPVCDPYRCRHAPRSGRCLDCGEHCARELEEVLLQNDPRRVAAVILEPIPGSFGGVIIPGDGYLQQVREICRRHEILLIADEVMTGFGRTGRWFACDHWDVVPDIMTMAKGITSGYLPMGATILREELCRHWDDRPLLHGHTYSGHTLGCAAVVASIKVYREDNLVRRSEDMGEYLLKKATELTDHHPSVGDVRGKGLFVGVDLVRDRRTKEPIGTSRNESVKRRILDRAMRNGVFLFSGFSPNVIILAPPLIVTRDQIDEGIRAVDDALSIADAELRS